MADTDLKQDAQEVHETICQHVLVQTHSDHSSLTPPQPRVRTLVKTRQHVHDLVKDGGHEAQVVVTTRLGYTVSQRCQAITVKTDYSEQ